MQNDNYSPEIKFTEQFKRDVRRLAKKYRLIYHVQGFTIIIMMTIYAKSEQEDISPKRIQEILTEFNSDKNKRKFH